MTLKYSFLKTISVFTRDNFASSVDKEHTARSKMKCNTVECLLETKTQKGVACEELGPVLGVQRFEATSVKLTFKLETY